MNSAIVVHNSFDHYWPWAADHMHDIWQAQGAVQFVRLAAGDNTLVHAVLRGTRQITRLACLGAALTSESLDAMPALKEVATKIEDDDPLKSALAKRGIRHIWQRSEGYWGQSVAEFGLALTICGLRRIPQLHHNMISDLEDWNYRQPEGKGIPGQRGIQFGDDTNFVNGTLEGKRVRIVGAGNIGSRYADFCHYLGADVAVWDPYATEPSFHRSGARREFFLDRLVKDADIFAPMVPLTPSTHDLVKAEHIRALPKGCLVVTVTRAKIVDYKVLYERVMNDELSLAADVFDHEPLEIGHQLLNRHNVIHTPHNAGRTKESNMCFVEMLAEQFKPA